jgi:hypothetical protein
MVLVIAVIAAGIWMVLMVLAFAVCCAGRRSDAESERLLRAALF